MTDQAAVFLRTILVFAFAFAPIVLVLIQQRTVVRQRSILDTLPKVLKNTALWTRAKDLLSRRYILPGRASTKKQRPDDNLSAPAVAYWASLLLVSLIMLSSWSFMLEEPLGIDWFVKKHNLFLLGPFESKDLPAAQTKTLAFTCISFCIAYIVIIYRMAMRLNINEYNSLENLFDAVHLTSCLVITSAGSIWLNLVGLPDPIVAAFAIAVGLRPDFYLGEVGRAVDRVLTRSGGPLEGQAKTKRAQITNLAPTAELAMIDGLSDDIVDRLKKIDICTCHRLAFYNPYVIWVRTSFNLQESVDWVAQASLATLFPEQNAAFRKVSVRTIVDLILRLEAGSEIVIKAVQMDAVEIPRILWMLHSMAHVVDLRELTLALLNQPALNRSREDS